MTNETRWTAGKWEPRHNGEEVRVVVSSPRGGYREIADLSFGDTSSEERAANAALISEAPAIASAAAALVREIQKRDGEGNLLPAHLYAPLMAALARAGAC